MTELMKSEGYRVLEVGGSAFERGFRYGAEHSSLIRKLLDSHYDFYVNFLNTTKDIALRDASKYVEPTKSYSEDVFSELRGMADGSGLKLDEIMLIAAFNEVFYPKLAKACTAFAVRNGATSDGLTYVGQNNDEGIDPWLDGECTTLTRYRQSDAPDALIYSYAGTPAMMGINSSGLSLCINALGFDAPKFGVPMLCVVREVINQRSIDEAVEAIERADRAFALNFVMGDVHGIANVEANPLKIKVTKSNDALSHTNHYMWCPVEGFTESKSIEYMKNSKSRCNRMSSLVEASHGKLDLNRLEEFLRDHENRPDMICAHVNRERGRAHWSRTLDGMIYVPERKEAWIARGNPCENEFKRYAVGN